MDDNKLIILYQALNKLNHAHDFFDDELSPEATEIRADIIKKCREIIKEHGDLG